MSAKKLAWEMRRCGIDTTRTAWIEYVREVSGRMDIDDWYASIGYELDDATQHRGGIAQDGRPVIVDAHGRTWVMSRAEFVRQTAAAVADAVAAEKNKRTAGQATPGEALTSVCCPLCQSVMAKSPICPNCSKGRAGYKILCICTMCAHEVYL